MIAGCGVWVEMFKPSPTGHSVGDVLVETEFRKLNKSVWRIGYANEYGTVKPKGLRLFAQYLETAVIWYRKPLPDNVDIIAHIEYIKGGHPLLIMLSSIGVGGATDTGYSIELGADANTHGILRRLEKTVSDNRYAVLSLGELHRIKINKRNGNIDCYLGEKLIFSYTDKTPLKGKGHEFLGLGLGKHYLSPTHGNSEAIFRYIKISPPQN